jgi:uncharacterized protein
LTSRRSAQAWVALVAAVGVLVAPTAHAERAIPPLTGPVIDEAGLLSRGDASQLEALSRSARAVNGGNGVQLQFFLVPSLEGEAIESFSMRAAEKWKLGTKGQDNGLLFVVSRDDRKMRIEVGGGLEGGLTDAQSGRIIRNVLAPAFRENRYGQGLYNGALTALNAMGALPEGVTVPQQARRAPGKQRFPIGFLLLIGFFVLMSRSFGGRRGGGGLGWFLLGSAMGNSWGRRDHDDWGGGGGFGGGGGGGWSGGGGGFSGGGSSGSW